MRDTDRPGHWLRALRALRPSAGTGPTQAWPSSVRSWAIDAVIAAAVIAFEVYVSQQADSWSPHAHQQAPPGVLALVLLGLGGRRWWPAAVTRSRSCWSPS